MILFESGNIKQSFSGSMSARGTLDQKLQPGNNNTAKKNLQKLKFSVLTLYMVKKFENLHFSRNWWQFTENYFDKFQKTIGIELVSN